MPSAVGYQPTLSTEMGSLQERITSTKEGSITSIQAVYVLADDLTDPTPATTFAHLDATTVLSRGLAAKETGASRDPITNVVSPSNEWWQEKIKANKGYRKFRYNALMFENEMRMIFKDVVASGEDQYSLSAKQPQAQEEDCYQPTMDAAEGSGDNEDECVGVDPVPSTIVSANLGSMNLSGHSPPIVPTTSGSHSKRKRGEWPIHKKKIKNSSF
ncbi:hypothetical protein K1719_028493 [Acacia pycnantha]|nr:hypothetical protein K1719_028493 [Acacia pycnantha]